MIATKRTAALIAALSLLGTVAPAAFAQDGSLVNFNQNIQTPNVQICPSTQILGSGNIASGPVAACEVNQDQSNSPADGESPPPPP